MTQIMDEVSAARDRYGDAIGVITEHGEHDVPITTDGLARMFMAAQQYIIELDQAIIGLAFGVSVLAERAGLPGLGNGSGADVDV